jgi:hypothetical protein
MELRKQGEIQLARLKGRRWNPLLTSRDVDDYQLTAITGSGHVIGNCKTIHASRPRCGSKPSRNLDVGDGEFDPYLYLPLDEFIAHKPEEISTRSHNKNKNNKNKKARHLPVDREAKSRTNNLLVNIN